MDADAIEALNFEQLATITDRLLVRGARISKRRPSTNRMALVPLARPAARATDPSIEHTVVVRRHRTLDTAAFVAGGIVLVLAAVASLV